MRHFWSFGRLMALLAALWAGVPATTLATSDSVTERRWVVLGDSISAAYGMSLEQGWVVQFQQKVQAQGYPIRMINESISGDTTAGGLARLPDVLKRHQPHAVIIELGGNDGLRGLSPKAMTDNLVAMIRLCQVAKAEVYLLGMKIPPNYGSRYTSLFEQAFVKAAEQTGVPVLPFFLEGIGGIQSLMQGDRIHPGVDAQELLVDNAWRFLQPFIAEQAADAADKI